ncbi:hypothetical protein KC315_g2109 [Hortaea werneckii]|nr:hypothetical protein KC315_g2109 [Hortaea werneckii]
MRIFTIAFAALLTGLSVTFAAGEDDSAHSLAIPVSDSVAREETMLRQSGDKLLCDCGPGYCCLQSGEKDRCVELAAGICPSPFNPAAGSVSKGMGEVVTMPTTTSTLPMESLDHMLTPSVSIEYKTSTPQRLPFAQSDAPIKGSSATSVTSSSLDDQPVETHATVSTVTEPTCDDNGCCTFPPSWTACQGGYLTKVGEEVLGSTETPSSEQSGGQPSRTTLGLDDNSDAAPSLSSSTSKSRDTCGDDKDHCAPENCNPSVLYGRCWSLTWNTSANNDSDHLRRDNPSFGNSSAAVVTTVHETVTASQSIVYVYDTFISPKEESSKSVAQGTSGVPTLSTEVSSVDHSATHDDFSVSTITTVVVTASEAMSSSILASMSTSTSTTTITSNITLTNPLYPAATTVVPPGYTHTNISNTSINTEIFVNISTFSATGLTISSTEVLSTGASSTLETGIVNSETSISSKVIRPSATETEPFNNGPQDFSPAATTNIGGGNHSSEGVKTTGGGGTFYVIAAVLGLAEIGGLMLLL